MANIKVIGFEEATGQLKEIYDDLISKRGKLASVHMIQSLNPATIVAHMDLYMSIMFSQSPLSRAQREMIAVVVSSANGCSYCMEHHGAALNNYWKNEERVAVLAEDYFKLGLDEVDNSLCKYAVDLTKTPGSFENIDKTIPLKEIGLDDRAILDATLVIAYFNFVNRIVLSMGVELEEKAGEGYKY